MSRLDPSTPLSSPDPACEAGFEGLSDWDRSAGAAIFRADKHSDYVQASFCESQTWMLTKVRTPAEWVALTMSRATRQEPNGGFGRSVTLSGSFSSPTSTPQASALNPQ